MKFGTIPLDDAEGAILAHSARLPGRALKKGHVLQPGDIDLLRENDITSVIAAKLDPDDVREDEAAATIARAIAGRHLRVGDAFTGRCNLFAEAHGVMTLDRARLDRLNLIHEAMTIATVAPYAAVTPGQMVATIKIIPFAVAQNVLDQALAAAGGEPLMSVQEFREMKAGLILTRLPGMKESVLDSTVTTIGDRLEAHGSHIAREIRCGHVEAEVAAAIAALQGEKMDLILIFGASATVDREDVVPAAVVTAGGNIGHFGMPVDPGNLLFLGKIEETPVVGMPGCARSPALNGVDWVLWRVLAGLGVAPEDIMTMGAGGLLKEFAERPQPRRTATTGLPTAREPRVAALLLAAGSSTRMGDANKLLAPVRGRSMVTWAADGILASKASPLIVVTGHEGERVQGVLEDFPATFVHNPDYREGLSSSLRTGLAALPVDIDAVVVCLGDMPEIQSEHIDQLIAAFDPVEGRRICVPVHGRKRGNPVLWSINYVPEMLEISGDVGAKSLLEDHADAVFEVTIDDDGILFDVDTPDRLQELTGRAANS